VKPEAKVRTEIKNAALVMGAKVYDLEQNRPTRQTPGIADLLIFFPSKYTDARHPRPTAKGRNIKINYEAGLSMWVECKAGKNKLSRYQELFAELCYGAGDVFMVCWSVVDFLAGCEWCGLPVRCSGEVSNSMMLQRAAIEATLRKRQPEAATGTRAESPDRPSGRTT
jgi:hypothetical protein